MSTRRLSPIAIIVAMLSPLPSSVGAAPLPDGFVYLRETAPEIPQDMRYFGSHNFIGRPIDGYQAPECILTRAAAAALKAVQEDVAAAGLRVKVFDCYRPTRAVAHFVRWSQDVADQQMKPEFYPHIDKADFFRLGYVAERSGHSRGSTVDLALEPAAAGLTPVAAVSDQPLVACTAPQAQRFPDSPLDFGTGFDCMDPLSHPDSGAVPGTAQHNRALLAQAMDRHGFRALTTEWWHFTLKAEPFPETYFDFPVTAPGAGRE
ncbi:M15 family metallopeptidase [uncultured Thiodictyon sp.]|uniref:M15 family metallopeptidase n=1 Tax=uncultured Thiodictyon sp. TaxID=1846217 RepID=UPI0025ED916F|nr:M15 family metallopeptidase [uncultured Thiodictyon sp.]